MKTKKVLAIIASVVLSISLLTACGDSSSSAAGSNSASSAAASSSEAEKATEYDTTVFTVSVPSGWGAAPVADTLKKFDGVTNPEQVYVLKGGKSQEDVMRYPYLWISYYKDAKVYVSSKGFYKDAEDIAPMDIDGKTWEGYKYTSSGYPGTCLTCKDGDSLWVCLFVLRNGENEINIQDEDVKTILSSLKTK